MIKYVITFLLVGCTTGEDIAHKTYPKAVCVHISDYSYFCMDNHHVLFCDADRCLELPPLLDGHLLETMP